VDDIREYVSRASVYVVPLRLGTGIRGKILEAWAMRKPVVSSAIAASGLIYEDGRNIAIADDPQAFTDRVCEIFKNPSLSIRLAEEGYHTAKSYYDWDNRVIEHSELYRELLRRGPKV
jgi:glycosyltransferase involved in cell wall biosynthesis